MKTKTQKTLIIGLDGGTWTLFDRLMNQGRMKHFHALVQHGARATLKSTLPPTTGPAWVSFATGKNPGKHGCFDFTYPGATLDSLKTISTDRINGKTVYEYLSEKGRTCILINLPVSFPPRTDEITITSLLTKGDQFVFPPELEEHIPALKDYRLTPDMHLLMERKTNDYINDIRQLEKNRFDCAKELFKREWDFFFLLFSGTDWIQHTLFDRLTSEDLSADDPGMAYYEELDNYIHWFSSNMDENTNLIFVSDHGFALYEGTFFINEWLNTQGYLKVNNKAAAESNSHRFDEELGSARKSVFTSIRLPFFVRNFIQKNRLLNRLATKIYTWLRDTLSLQVKPEMSADLANSHAYCPANELNGIYINRKQRFDNGTVEEKDYHEIRSEIIEKLKALRDKNGNNVFKNVYAKEEIYQGDMLDQAPDILLELDRYITGASFPIKILELKKVIHHHADGIFLGIGPAFRKGILKQPANLIDLAPTILYLMHQPLPRDMDGQVLVSALKQTYRSENPLQYHEQSAPVAAERRDESPLESVGDDAVIERLKGLGYIE